MASMSAVGKIGAMCCREAMCPLTLPLCDAPARSTISRAALVVGALAVVRAVLLDRAPRGSCTAASR